MDEGGSQQGQQFTLTASKGVQSRTHLGNPYINENGKKILPMYWTKGDRIYVSSKDGRVTGTLTLTSEPGKPTGTFTGFVFGDPADLYYSIYPVPDGGKVDLSTLTGREIRTPMVGTISANKNVAFDNTCGMMVVENLDYEEGNETTANFKLFAGTATDNLIPLAATAEIEKDENGVVKVDAEGNVSLKYTSKTDKFINLTDAEFIEGKLYIPYDLKSNATKENIHFYMQSDDSQILEPITNSPVSLKDATIGKPLYADAKVAVDANGSVSKVHDKVVPSTSADVTVEINTKENAVNIPSVPEEVKNVTIEMPIQLSDNKKEAIVAIEEIKSNDAVITITSTSTESSAPDAGGDNSTTATASQIEEMTVILPSNATQEQVEQRVIIDMPNTTVTVKSDDGNVLFIKEMTVATAPSTLVVEKDVEIETLIIKQGNVQVFGKVGEIKRADDNDDKETVVTIEKGGEVNAVFGKDKINVIDNNKPSVTPEQTTVSDFKELKAALEDAEPNIKFGDNIVLDEPLAIIAQTEIDLNGKTLSVGYTDNKGKNAVITCSEALILRNGNLTGGKTSDLHDYYISMSGGAHKQLLLTNVSLSTGTGIANAVFMDDDLLMTGSSSKITTSGNAIHYVANQSGPRYYSRIYGTVNGDIYIESTHKTLNAMLIFEGGTINGNLVKGASSNASLNLPEYVFNNGAQVGAGYIGWENIGVYVEEGGDKPEGGDHVAEGTPVTDLVGLQAILEDPDNRTNIILTAPIELTENYAIDLGGRILFIDENIFANHPDATAAISSTANLTIRNATIYGPELKKADTLRYMIEHIGTTSIENTYLTLNSVTVESRAIKNAVHVKDGFLYFQESTINAGQVFKLEAESKWVKGSLESSNITGDISFTHNHQDDNTFKSGISIEGGTVVNGSLFKEGTYKETMIFEIKEEDKLAYNYSNISGNGWFEATVNYIQHQLATTGLVGISAWNVKNDVTFDVNNQVNDGIIRFYVDSLEGEGTITFNNTNTNGETQELYLDVKEGFDKVQYTGEFKVQNENASSEGE